MARADLAIAVVLQHEGGYAEDSGGPTMCGWTLPALKSLGLFLTPDELRAKDAAWAGGLYERHYWNGFGAILDQAVATKCLDMAVNMEGPRAIARGKAVQIIQRALNTLGANVDTDGIWGQRTCEAVNKCAPDLLLTAIISCQARFYRALASQDPVRYGPYLAEWLARAAWPHNIC